jgi:CDP-diacylglycerol--glycerol-3-phosphate 3-phosphatidyltransferase
MPSVYQLKPAFQSLLRPFVHRLAASGVTANQVTVAAMMLSLAGGAVIVWRHEDRRVLLLLPFVLLVRMALNAIDGMLAREHNQKSALGAVLNELGDVLSDVALYLPLVLVPGFDSSLVVGIVLLAVLSEMTGVVAVQIGASRRYDGPMGKSDRAFTFGLLGLLLGFGAPLEKVLRYVLILVFTLLAITIFNRARRALAEIRVATAK